MAVLLKAVQLIFALSILVIIHELGHFLFARLFKIRVEKFYLFFDPWFSLFKFKPKNSDTEYGIGWLPLGGYCKIAGMVDESMDKKQLEKAPQPWEFRSKPAWQRFFVMFGGVLFNIILAFIIYGCILYAWGEEYVQVRDLPYGVQCDSIAEAVGFCDGDHILAFDQKPVGKLHELQIDLIRQRPTFITVLRKGDTVRLRFDQSHIPALLNHPDIFEPRLPFIVGQVPDTSINRSAGLLPNDRFIAIDHCKTDAIQDIRPLLSEHRGGTITATVLRQGREEDIDLKVSDDGLIQVLLVNNIDSLVPVTRRHYAFLAAFPAGAVKACRNIGNYIKELGLMLSPKTKAYKSVGSFIAIGNIFPSVWDWRSFWNITALLSIMLAVLNILPIPALDGGHIMFLLYEIVTGRKPGDKFMEYAQLAGMILLFGLIFLAFGNDIYRLFK